MKSILFFSFALLLLTACKKVEGEGGRASISGKIEVEQRLHLNGIYQDSEFFPGAKEDVYIIYGTDETMYGDRIEASYDGSFKFEFLQPGTYTIFAYNEIFNPGNSISNNDDDYYTYEKVSTTITIGKKEEATVGTINISKAK